MAKENELIVTDPMCEVGGMDDSTVARLSQTFTLNVLNVKTSSPIQLKFPGSHTLLEVKKDVYTVTNIAVRHQKWQGWPPTATDSTTLALSGIPLEHDLVLESTEPAPTSSTDASTNANSGQIYPSNPSNDLIEVDSDSSVDEFEDASDFNGDDDIFTAPSANRRVKDLSKAIGVFIFLQTNFESIFDI